MDWPGEVNQAASHSQVKLIEVSLGDLNVKNTFCGIMEEDRNKIKD